MTRSVNDITGIVVDAAYKLHVSLGPGLLENVYETVLVKDLEARGLRVERQRTISIDYRGMHFKDCCRIDVLVEGLVIVEVKSVETLLPLHSKQLLTYLRLSNLRIGLLINFGAARLKDGIRRILNGYTDSVPSWLCVNENTSDRSETMQKE
jgi:iron complex transport system substrate-binding protein